MSNISKRRKEGSRAKMKSMGVGDHKEFLKRITKTLYYGQLPALPCLSLPVTEVSCEVWSVAQRGRSVRRLHPDAAAAVARRACVSPCALVLAVLYLERLRQRNARYIEDTPPLDLFLVSLMVGNKFLQDDGEDEEVICSEWAASGGMELGQLKKLEVEFLNAIEWNVFVSDTSFEAGLRWLERSVALRQARLRGFFTYGDLAAAGAGAGAAPLTAALRALAAGLALGLAGLLALLASLLLARTCLHARPAPATPATPAAPAADTFHADLPTAYVPNSTKDTQDPVELPLPEFRRPLCCGEWTKRNEVPKRNWFDGVAYPAWNLEAWRSRTSVLNWLYQSSLVNPLQRWLGRVNEYAEVARRGLSEAPTRTRHDGRCVQRLHLSRLAALAAAVSDR